MLATVAVLAALAVPPSPTRWVEDQAGFLSPAARATLDARLEGYQRATGHQVVVWIGKSLEGAPIDDFATRTFAAWKIGRKGLDDGIAIFIFADDRKIAIEVGYGLEGKVPDAIASRIIREVMAPRIRAGDHDGAVTAGIDSVLAVIEGKPWSGAAPRSEQRRGSPTEWILGGIGLVAFIIFAIFHPRMALFMLWAIMSGGRGGGGGYGGFGGGGGRSGGGGARGGW